MEPQHFVIADIALLSSFLVAQYGLLSCFVLHTAATISRSLSALNLAQGLSWCPTRLLRRCGSRGGCVKQGTLLSLGCTRVSEDTKVSFDTRYVKDAHGPATVVAFTLRHVSSRKERRRQRSAARAAAFWDWRRAEDLRAVWVPSTRERCAQLWGCPPMEARPFRDRISRELAPIRRGALTLSLKRQLTHERNPAR